MTTPSLAARQDAARARWQTLADRMRTVTPEAIGRFALTTAVILGLVAVVATAGRSLAPFIVGGIIAYAVLPIANRLDAFMPRVIAAVVAELVALGILAGVVVVIVPPLLRGLGQIVTSLPTPAEVDAGLAQLEQNIGQLPSPLNVILADVAQETVARLSGALDALVAGTADFITGQILGVVGTASFLLGLLVIPAWILTIVADERRLKREGKRLIAPAIRADVVALVRIVDRAFGAFLRVQVVLAIGTGVLVYLGIAVAERLGVVEARYAVAASVLLGALQLIPELGFVLGFLPILLVLGIQGPVAAGVLAVIYIGAQRLTGLAIGERLKRGVLDVHPLLLLPAVVVLSDFGPLWLLASAPIVAVLRDVVRYLAGRLAEPPKPAGLLPGERPVRRGGANPAPAASTVPVPSVYAAGGRATGSSSVPLPSVYAATERSTP